jgi:hypothetical protein
MCVLNACETDIAPRQGMSLEGQAKTSFEESLRAHDEIVVCCMVSGKW